MKKELPFVKPITACYPATSHASGILFADEYISNWMFNNFIQIFQVESNGAIDYYDFAIDNNPYLSYNELNYSFVYHNWNSINDFIMACINDDYYIRVFNNISKNSLYSMSNAFQHDILVFGFDNENRTYNVADHFKNGEFQIEVCSFDELSNAIDTYDSNKFSTNPAFLNSFQIIQKEKDLMRLRFSMYTPDEMDYILSLNLQRIISSLKDYVDCKPTINWYTRGRVMDANLASTHKWGLACYDVIRTKIEQEDISFLMQSCYIINNHKLVMIERIKKIDIFYKFSQKDIHIQHYKDLQKMTSKLLRLVIKYMILDERKSLVKKLCDLITEIKAVDYKYTILLISDLQGI